MQKYASDGTSASTLAKLGLEQSTVTKSKIQELLSLSLDGFKVLLNDNDVILPNGDTVFNGAALLVPCGGRSESINAIIVNHLLDEDGVNHFNYLIDGGRIVTENACARLEDAVVVLFLEDASAKKRGFNASYSPMEVSAASSLPNKKVDVYDMRMPTTKLPKDAPQLDKGKLK